MEKMEVDDQKTIHQIIMSGEPGSQDMAKRMIDLDPSLINKVDESLRMPIHWSCLFGFKELVEYILKLGGQEMVNVPDDTHTTPLIIASSAGKIEIVELLIKKGADVNAKNSNGHSSLQYACSKNKPYMVDLLLKNGADPNICDNLNSTPLHRSASLGYTDIVQMLLKSKDYKLDINCKDSTHSTPLHLACEEDRIELACLLIRSGAKIDSQNKQKQTPLDLARPSAVSILTSQTQQ